MEKSSDGAVTWIQKIGTELSVFCNEKLISVVEPGVAWFGELLAEQLDNTASVGELGHTYNVISNNPSPIHHFLVIMPIINSHSKN